MFTTYHLDKFIYHPICLIHHMNPYVPREQGKKQKHQNPRMVSPRYVCGLITPSIYLCIYLSMYLSIYPSIHRSIDRSIYLSVYLYLSMYLPMYLSMYLSFYLSICVSIYVSIYVAIYVSIYLSISLYLSIYRSIETCSIFHVDNVKSEAILGDFLTSRS